MSASPDLDDVPLPATSATPLLRLIGDRTAVLVLGLVAGFAVGLSFAPTPVVAPVPAGDAPTARPAAGDGVPAQPARRAAADGAIDPRAVRRVAASGVVRIGVFGDSFGVGVWDALYRMLPRDEGYAVLRFAKEATGFTRYRVLDMEKQAREQLARDPVDIAVISVGVNDAQPMWEGKLYPFMSESWKQVVGARIDAFVATARSTGASVYWQGLPAMRDGELDAKVRALDDFYAAHMVRLSVPFFDGRKATLDAAGRYASHLPDAKGVPRLMRTGDGVHMIGIGYQRIADPMIARIRVQAGRLRAAAGRPAPRPAPTRVSP